MLKKMFIRSFIENSKNKNTKLQKRLSSKKINEV